MWLFVVTFRLTMLDVIRVCMPCYNLSLRPSGPLLPSFSVTLGKRARALPLSAAAAATTAAPCSLSPPLSLSPLPPPPLLSRRGRFGGRRVVQGVPTDLCTKISWFWMQKQKPSGFKNTFFSARGHYVPPLPWGILIPVHVSHDLKFIFWTIKGIHFHCLLWSLTHV